jgi:hypothetical protein
VKFQVLIAMLKVQVFWDDTVVWSVFTTLSEDVHNSLLKYQYLRANQCDVICQKIEVSLTMLPACYFASDSMF